MKKYISLAKDFNRDPAGRFLSDGPFSGEKFREELLYPALKDPKIEKVIVELNGLGGVGSSFWDEAFGGLIRNDQLPLNEIRVKLEIRCEDASLIKHVWSFINSASAGE